MATATFKASPDSAPRRSHGVPRGQERTPFQASSIATPQERVVALLLPVAAFFLSWWQVGRLPNLNISICDILLLVCAVAILTSRGLNGAMFGRMSIAWIMGVILLIGGMLVGSLAHGEFLRWPVVGGQYAFAFLLIPMLLTTCSRSLLERCAIAYVLGVATSQAIGVALTGTLDYETITRYVNRHVVTGNGRLGAMTGEPNSNGAVCTFALIFLLHAVINNRIRRVYAAGLALLIIAGLVASASFTGVAAATIAVLLVLVLSQLRLVVTLAIPVALAITAYVVLDGPVPAAFEQRVGEAVMTGDPTKAGTFVGRTVLIKEAWDMADQNLVIGLGSDGYRRTSVYGMPVHQLYLLVLNEGGVLSFLGLCLIMVAMLVEAIILMGRNRVDGVCCLAGFAVFFIYTMSLPHMFGRMWNGPPLLLFALANAGIHALGQRVPAGIREHHRRVAP
ncbi:O-antigen ligase family protein [Novosphingobium panipatense]|uniref:O-antigen ligase family protein n=2 Tax=Novosphingobium panipatense TaxID=428991 RepID=UPI0024B66E43|nr:O-antigen ligase family protein [Novosphingobium panipatense]